MIRQLEKQNSVSLSVISASNNDNNYTNTKLGAVFTAYKWYDVSDSSLCQAGGCTYVIVLVLDLLPLLCYSPEVLPIPF